MSSPSSDDLLALSVKRTPSDRPKDSGVSRELLQDVMRKLASRPELLASYKGDVDARVRDLRGRASVTVGLVATRLHNLGFNQCGQLYRIRDDLAAGNAVDLDDLSWLKMAIAGETP